MKYISNTEQCEAFVREFEEDALRKYGVPGVPLFPLSRQVLTFDAASFDVYLEGWLKQPDTGKGVRLRFTEPETFFNPSMRGDDEALVEHTTVVLGLPVAEAEERLKKIGLLVEGEA